MDSNFNLKISKPDAGWCGIEIGDFKDVVSDVWSGRFILDLLDVAALEGLRKVVELNAEDHSSYIVFTEVDRMYIIKEDEEGNTRFYREDVHIVDFGEALIREIEKNFDDWAEWGSRDKEHADFKRTHIIKAIDKIRERTKVFER